MNTWIENNHTSELDNDEVSLGVWRTHAGNYRCSGPLGTGVFKVALKAKNLEDAKTEAYALVRERLRVMLASLP